jgi:hypothetical protein
MVSLIKKKESLYPNIVYQYFYFTNLKNKYVFLNNNKTIL